MWFEKCEVRDVHVQFSISGMWNVNCEISREPWIQFFEKWTPGSGVKIYYRSILANNLFGRKGEVSSTVSPPSPAPPLSSGVPPPNLSCGDLLVRYRNSSLTFTRRRRPGMNEGRAPCIRMIHQWLSSLKNTVQFMTKRVNKRIWIVVWTVLLIAEHFCYASVTYFPPILRGKRYVFGLDNTFLKCEM